MMALVPHRVTWEIRAESRPRGERSQADDTVHTAISSRLTERVMLTV